MKKFSIECRKLSELDAYKGIRTSEGDRAYIAPHYRKALRENPFCMSTDVACQKVGYVGGKIGGTEIQFPLLLSLDGQEVLGGSGSLTQVDEWARSSGLGLAISDVEQPDPAYNPVLGEGAGLSQIAVKVHRCIGYQVFEYPRLVMLLKSRAVVEMKLKGLLAIIVSRLVDVCFWFYAKCIVALSCFAARRTRLIQVDSSNNEDLAILEKFTAPGEARFAEVHNAQWFKWILTNSFSENGKTLAYIVHELGEPIGFFMVKTRFHKQASHRGFKNVWLGSVIEWGCAEGKLRKILWRIVRWAAESRKELDAIEFPAQEFEVQRFFKHLGWRHIGEANFCYKICPDSGFAEPPGMNEARNWRIRPAMGDVGLS